MSKKNIILFGGLFIALLIMYGIGGNDLMPRM